ncbi:pseudaminic acid synthase [Cohnella cholangitidis]|uniref:Pseudaminic acid synthase n=1 Tax=Cohnella cholangitidis TaxID=2598458 RepID=A0A7G5BXH6_9BACL|nr:pseudaminic acid synthase [Cohnella cholangitidis]
MIQDIAIAGRLIGKGHKPFLIAEMSGNHNQSLERALAIVDAAADAGADALKLQTYTASTMTLDVHEGDFFISDSNNIWEGTSLYKLYEEAYTPWEWHKPIFDRCKERGILAFSTPFDASAVEFLESLEVPAYKIASFENTDLPLIRKAAATGKPLIISTGMASVAELHETVNTAREAGCTSLILLKCTSTYPSSPVNSNLATIPHMEQLFQCQIGLSDHTMGVGTAVASVVLGARIIEKHFTLSRADGGVDSTFSLEPQEFKSLSVETERAWQSLGRISYGATDAEKNSLKYRRSLYVAENMKAGEIFSEQNVRAIRPGLGLPTKYLERILGKTAKEDIKKGTPLSWELL